LSEWLETAGRRFARLVTRAVVARPWLWRVFRPLMRAQFDRLASIWDARRGPEAHAALEAAFERLDTEPRRVLDVGTGTGQAARYIAARFPAVEVVAVDQSPAMIEEARLLLPDEIHERVRFEVADAAGLPYADAAFDLLVLLNMIPFFDEIARLTAPGGSVVFAFSSGPETPIYTPPETLRERLVPRGFDRFEEFAAEGGTALLARRAEAG
jgi:ubiquinone/menaquinone biosynthesis C-methylase UbiE